MTTLRFLIACAELVASPAFLAWYAAQPRLATILARRKLALDFSRQLG